MWQVPKIRYKKSQYISLLAALQNITADWIIPSASWPIWMQLYYFRHTYCLFHYSEKGKKRVEVLHSMPSITGQQDLLQRFVSQSFSVSLLALLSASALLSEDSAIVSFCAEPSCNSERKVKQNIFSFKIGRTAFKYLSNSAQFNAELRVLFTWWSAAGFIHKAGNGLHS